MKYAVPAICSVCGGQRTVDKYHVKSPYVCRPCSSRRTGLKTGVANSPFKATHGMTDTGVYQVWCRMKQRCQNPEDPSYKNYGGRGIALCDAWNKDFSSFGWWAIANGYAKGLQIDRIDNDGPYSPENCRWVTHKQNSRNKRTNVLKEEQVRLIRRWYELGYKQTHIARIFHVSPQTVHLIVKGKQWA